MTILCVDDNRLWLSKLTQRIQNLELVQGAAIYSCCSPHEAIHEAESWGCDVLITAIHLDGEENGGFVLSRKIKGINPRVNISLITDHKSNEEAYEAFQIHASGYVERTRAIQRLAEEFANLRFALN